ncbi:MAG: hypothetical protein AAGA28_02230 [Pseudomonadota bacterium]
MRTSKQPHVPGGQLKKENMKFRGLAVSMVLILGGMVGAPVLFLAAF